MDTIVWTPKNPEASNMWHFMRHVATTYQQSMTTYQQLHAWSIEYPALFWQALCDYFAIQWDTPATEIINHYNEIWEARWFTGASFNFAEKLLSRNDDHPALVSIHEDGTRATFSYTALRHQVAQCAAGLKAVGIRQGDRVGAVMPNTANTIIAMLATASLGAIWSSCSPDFGAPAAIDRLGQIEPKLLFVCDGHTYQGKHHDAFEKIKNMTALIPSIQHVVVSPMIHANLEVSTLDKAMTWDDFLKPATTIEFASLPFAHPLYVLFSSGTTGKPKCIVHGAGGTLLQHIKELGLHTNITDRDNLCFYTTCGWMMWNWMASALALGATVTLFEGAPMFPEPNRLFKLIEQEKITVFGTSAKFISAVEKEGYSPIHDYSLNSLRCILATGSPLLPKNYDFVYQHIKHDVQLSSISGGTDIVSCFALGNPILPVYRGEIQCLGLGMSVAVFDDEGQPLFKQRGELVCTKPFPSMPIEFWHDVDKKMYQQAYFNRFPGVWAHGDFAEITAHHGLIIYGRSDSILNPGGVRIGTAEIYRQVEKIPEVLDSVVIGQDWQDDVRVVLFVKLREEHSLTEELQQKIRKTIREHASPRHVPAKILQVADIPRTMNGKVVEVAVRETVLGHAITNVESLANPEALLYFKNRKELQA